MSAAHIRDALRAIGKGEDGDAIRLLAAPSGTPTAGVAAAIGWYLLRKPERAIAELRGARAGAPRATQLLALRTEADLCGELGWNQESRAALEEWLALDPPARPARRRLVDLLARGGAWEAAFALLDGPYGAAFPLRASGIARELGRSEVARDRLMTLVRPDQRLPARRRLADLLAKAGSVHEAMEVLDAGTDPELLADRARLATWCGDFAGAKAMADRALADGAMGDDRDRAETVLGICILLDDGPALGSVVPGDIAAQEARDRLTVVLARNPRRGEARIWRAHAHALLGANDEALADIDAGVPAVGGFDIGALLLRHLVEHRDTAQPGFGGRSLEELEEGLERLGVPRAESRTLRTNPALEEAFGRAFVSLAGNRSGSGSMRRDGNLAPLGVSLSPRSGARRALELIRTCAPADVFAQFDVVESRWPESSMGAVHRAELSLWLGRYEEAKDGFERSLRINRHTRWGWIGQLANESFLGRPERALELGEEGVRVMKGYGPSHYVYRGEALWRLGRPAEARADLEYAVGVGPSRMGARVTLALICAEQGDNVALTEHMAVLRSACAGMLAVALEELGEPPSVIWGESPDSARLLPVLGRAHTMMRGNRSSSCHTWFNAAGALRINENRGGEEDPFRARLADRLTQAQAILALTP